MEGYDEALILYLLALGSPTHPIAPACYDAWCSTYEWKEIYGIDFLYAGPLFIHQMSHIWCDFRGIRDRYMREHDCDYFENSRRATLIQQRHAVANPNGFKHPASSLLGHQCQATGRATRPRGSAASNGSSSTTSPGASPMARTTEPWPLGGRRVAAVRARHRRSDAPSPPGAAGQRCESVRVQGIVQPGVSRGDIDGVGWVSPYHFGINEGPTVLMIENHRTGMIWSLMRRCEALEAGLRLAGFSR